VDASPAALGRRERKKLQTRERILDVASALIAEQGLAATTVDQISEEVDISQATFFNYFATKTALVEALFARLTDRWNRVAEAADTANVTTTEKVAALFHTTADLTNGQHRLVRDLIVERARTPSVEPEGTWIRGYFREQLAAGQARGEVRTDQDAAVLADSVVGLFVAVVLFWTTEADYPIAERLQATAPLAIALISPRAG
jgi:AcrR family transcriptional regulator